MNILTAEYSSSRIFPEFMSFYFWGGGGGGGNLCVTLRQGRAAGQGVILGHSAKAKSVLNRV